MLDLIERPDLVHAAVERMVDAWMVELDQFVALNLLALDCNNTRIGSGGYGYTRELPGAKYDPEYVQPHNMWGCSNAQIFSEVSPQMHWEFALQHDLRWLERLGLDLLRLLRAAGPQDRPAAEDPEPAQGVGQPVVRYERVVSEVGTRLRPEPQAEPGDPCRGRLATRNGRGGICVDFLESARGCHVELIMKDISTVRHQPQRLWEWAAIAMEVARNSHEVTTAMNSRERS